MSDSNNRTPINEIVEGLQVLSDIGEFIGSMLKNAIDTFGQYIIENVDIERLKEFEEDFYNIDKKMTWASLLFGQYGWAISPDKCEPFFYKPMEKIYEQLRTKTLSSQVFEDKLNNCVMENIDIYLTHYFDDTQNRLYCNDIDKFIRAKQHFQDGYYFECALLLVGVIDSINIKVAMNDGVKTQGLPAFKHIWEKHMSKYFDKELKSINLKETALKEKLSVENVNIYNDIKDIADGDIDSYMDIGNPAISLATCFLFLFRTELWSADCVPSFHRSWLVHGMYKITDVDKLFCLKLFAILHLQTELYQTLSIKYA